MERGAKPGVGLGRLGLEQLADRGLKRVHQHLPPRGSSLGGSELHSEGQVADAAALVDGLGGDHLLPVVGDELEVPGQLRRARDLPGGAELVLHRLPRAGLAALDLDGLDAAGASRLLHDEADPSPRADVVVDVDSEGGGRGAVDAPGSFGWGSGGGKKREEEEEEKGEIFFFDWKKNPRKKSPL